MKKAKEFFDEYFEHWNIELPLDDIQRRSPGAIQKAGWTIRYIFGRDGGRNFLEFYATHRMTDDRHHKVYEDGENVDMDAICSMICYDPNIPGDEERKHRENKERNNRIYKELQEKGLDIMTINTYLSLNEVPHQDKNKKNENIKYDN